MIPVPILHLDDSVVVVDKPAGLLVHRTRPGAEEDALLQRVRDQLGRRIYPVHRLDRMSSGLMAYALSSQDAQLLQVELQAEDACKEYLVLARGCCPAVFESREPLVDDKGIARAARSEFHRLVYLPEIRASLLRARLHTGRYHQIRRHLALAGHHVMGDPRYGKARRNRFLARRGLTRIFLHAWRLDIAHPRGGRLAPTAPLAPDLRAFLARLPDAPSASLWEPGSP